MPAVLVERRGPVALLTLDRPERFDAFDPAMALEVRRKVRAVAEDEEVGATLQEHLRAERRWNAASARHPDLAEGLVAFAEERPPRSGRSQS